MKYNRPIFERFWEKVQVESPNQCWPWLGYRRSEGRYGSINIKGRAFAAHRLSWLLNRGYLPDGMCVLHHCDNGLCVNPAHLFLGTQADNVADMYRKGRGVNFRGEDVGNSKLTTEDVLEIRRRRRAGESGVALAEEFGVTNPLIYQIALGRAWSHVDAEFEEVL